MRLLFYFFIGLVLFSPLAQGQPLPITGNMTDYLRIMSMRGQLDTDASWNIQPMRMEWLKANSDSTFSNPWKSRYTFLSNEKVSSSEADFRFHVYAPTIFSSFNSKLPSGGNDGALWQGKGYNSSISTGIWAQYKFIEVSIKPEFGYSENQDYPLSFFSDSTRLFAYPYYTIDKPLRFGDDRISWANLGDSFIKLTGNSLSFAFSNQHHWLGSSRHNPILMSNNAPGFRHFYLETTKPLPTVIGTFESRWYWGKLQQSDYYYEAPDPGRYLTGLIINYSPSFLPNTHIAFAKSQYERWPEERLNIGDVTQLINPFTPTKTPENTLEFEQLRGFIFRWVAPESGSEMYAEFFKTGHEVKLSDFWMKSEFNRVVTLGAVKTLDLRKDRFIELQIELNQLESPTSQFFETDAPYLYRNSGIGRGYSQNGQIIGASIGPGSNQQFLKASLFDHWGKVGFFARRIVNDNDGLLENIDEIRTILGRLYGARRLRDVEMHTGMEGTVFFKQLEADLSIYRMLEYNRYYYLENDDMNYHIELRLRYNIPNSLR